MLIILTNKNTFSVLILAQCNHYCNNVIITMITIAKSTTTYLMLLFMWTVSLGDRQLDLIKWYWHYQWKVLFFSLKNLKHLKVSLDSDHKLNGSDCVRRL
jgi:hypothetical protein